MRKQYAVIGLGRFGLSLAATLAKAGNEVLVIDTNEDIVQKYSDLFTHAVTADTTDEQAIKALGLRNFDVVVVAIGHDVQASVLTTLLLKEIGVKYIVAKADNQHHGKMLEKIGADKVVFPERDMGKRIAHNLMAAGVVEYIEVAQDLGLMETAVPASLQGISLLASDLRPKYGITVLGIRRNGRILLSPSPEEVFREGDALILVGDSTGIHHFEKDYCD
ncbi:MAG: TrkA family potassium uptake protein [Sporomusaceae bacterium]|nr:TrkA family potassium uptake protein [Sporomusaceae bacterium]